MILVVGATGRLGNAICRELRARGRPTCALVRRGSAGEVPLREMGVEVRHGDLKEPPSLDRACDGVTGVITTANSTVSRRTGDNLRTVDRDGQLALLGSARRGRVARFVYTSVTPNVSSATPFVAIKREVEQAVRESGMSWTILQPSKFMELWFGPTVGWDVAGGKLTVFGEGTTRCAYVSLDDVARVGVLALEREDLAARVLPLGGPDAVSELDVVRVLADVTGRQFRVRHVPTAMMRLMSLLSRPFDPIFSSLMGMGAEMSVRADLIDAAPLQHDLGLRFTTVREHLERMAGNVAAP